MNIYKTFRKGRKTYTKAIPKDEVYNEEDYDWAKINDRKDAGNKTIYRPN